MSLTHMTDEEFYDLMDVAQEYQSIANAAITKCESMQALIDTQEEMIAHLKERNNILMEALDKEGYDLSPYQYPEQD